MELFFTQDEFDKYSFAPKLFEHLQSKEIELLAFAAKQKQEQQQQQTPCGDETQERIQGKKKNAQHESGKGGKHQENTYQPSVRKQVIRVPYPRLSWLTAAEQKLYLELFAKLHQPGPHTTEDVNTFKELQPRVLAEQDEFQTYLEHAAYCCYKDYNHVHPEAARFLQEHLSRERTRVHDYPQYYKMYDTVQLAYPRQPPTDLSFKHTQTLLQMGEVVKISLPNLEQEHCPPLPVAYEKVGARFPAQKHPQKVPVCSKDETASRLAQKHKVNVVMSHSSLQCLVDNNPQNLSRQWQIPVTVRFYRNPDGSIAQKVVYIDKPLPQQQMNCRDKTNLFFKFSVKTRCQNIKHPKTHKFGKSSDEEVKDGKQETDTENIARSLDADSNETSKGLEESIADKTSEECVGVKEIDVDCKEVIPDESRDIDRQEISKSKITIKKVKPKGKAILQKVLESSVGIQRNSSVPGEFKRQESEQSTTTSNILDSEVSGASENSTPLQSDSDTEDERLQIDCVDDNLPSKKVVVSAPLGLNECKASTVLESSDEKKAICDSKGDDGSSEMGSPSSNRGTRKRGRPRKTSDLPSPTDSSTAQNSPDEAPGTVGDTVDDGLDAVPHKKINLSVEEPPIEDNKTKPVG